MLRSRAGGHGKMTGEHGPKVVIRMVRLPHTPRGYMVAAEVEFDATRTPDARAARRRGDGRPRTPRSRRRARQARRARPRAVPPQVLAQPRADHPDRAHQPPGDGLVRLLPGLPGHQLGRPGPRLDRLLLRRLALSRRRRTGGPGPRARDDAADFDGDRGRLRGLRRHQPGRLRPGLLVGAGGAGDHHAAGALAGDEGHRSGAGRPGRPCGPAARRRRAPRRLRRGPPGAGRRAARR